MWIFFLLSIFFIGLLLILVGYYVSDYISLICNETLSGIDYIMFNFFYVIVFLLISILEIVFSVILYFHKIDM